MLVSLTALWAFAAYVTLRDGLNLLGVSALDTGVGRPTEAVVTALQQERRLSLVALGSGGSDQHTALVAQRASTDEADATFRRLVSGTAVRWTASAAAEQRIGEAMQRVDGLAGLRAAIDARTVDRGQVAAAFRDLIDAEFRIFGSLATLSDPDVAKDVRTLIALTRAQEVLAQEDSLLAGVLAAGRFTAGEPEQFVELVGAQRFLYGEAAAELPEVDRAKYTALAQSPTFTRFRALEDLVIDRGRVGAPLPVAGEVWRTTVEPVHAGLREVVLAGGESLVARAKPAALGVLTRLLLAGGLGLLAVVASIVMSIKTTRALLHQLEKLREAAWDLANVRLPKVVERLSRGEEVDVATEAPPLVAGEDEIGQVKQAFNAVQETAVRVAVEQAELRRSVRDVFLNLARRTQALVHRQLKLLDTMERREANAEELADLFRVDHLATRMRRNSENLIVLSGAVPGRGWRGAVPFVDVLRGAIAEVEDYTRVTVLPTGSVSLVGRAVGDTIHLLAELIENAVSFSPPYTTVHVGGQLVANGFAVEIEDRGLGMSEADMDTANEQLKHPPEFSLTGSARLGLYVVGRLAERHGIRIRLRESPYGGTTAIVLIPRNLVVEDDDAAPRANVLEHRRTAITTGEPDLDGPADLGPVHDNDGQPVGLAADNGGPVGPVGLAADNGGPVGPVGFAADNGGSVGSLDHLTRADLVRSSTLYSTWSSRETTEPAAPAPAQRGDSDHIGVEQLATPFSLPDRRPVDDDSAAPDAGPVAGQDDAGSTLFGLPRRVRQATRPAPSWNQETVGLPTWGAGGSGTVRSPEEMREALTRYQTATVLGRSAAERSADGVEHAVPPIETALTPMGPAMPAMGPAMTPMGPTVRPAEPRTEPPTEPTSQAQPGRDDQPPQGNERL